MPTPPAGRAVPLLLLVLLFSCSSTLSRRPDFSARPRQSFSRETEAVQRKLAEGAHRLLGRRELVVNGRRFTYDCTGTILAIYWYAGIDLARDFDKHQGNGVTRLYRSLEADNLIYHALVPMAGDVIFWDNTYDRNGDGLWNDPLTHVGMVLDSDAHGSIRYVHLNYTQGIVIERMNLLEPGVHEKVARGRLRIFNSPIRLSEPGRPHPPLWLAGQLYRVLGMGYLFEPRRF